MGPYGLRLQKTRSHIGAGFFLPGIQGKGAKAAPYAHIIELGSRGGVYTAKRGLFSVFAPGGQILRVPQITRRGVQARGFIEKAFKSKVSAAEQRIAKAIQNLVES